jgi:hypothetical protein
VSYGGGEGEGDKYFCSSFLFGRDFVDMGQIARRMVSPKKGGFMKFNVWVSVIAVVALALTACGPRKPPPQIAQVSQTSPLHQSVFVTEVAGKIESSEMFPQEHVQRAYDAWGTGGYDHLSTAQLRQLYFTNSLKRRTDVINTEKTAARYLLDVDVAKLLITDGDQGNRTLTYDLDITYTLRDRRTGEPVFEYQDVQLATEKWGYQDLDVSMSIIWENAVVGSLKRMLPQLTAAVK